ncbi:hypothetical protein RHSP_08857 [Rhizobium freirei PRF 81]|uniref:Uncharacterized protein n=1 Tax=Rhizobium freirei PRF 81 TaxID=363754 RepID=N6V678_9HYPH|nr:hypothetical protein RHSP_08857 [Rhizobium freirei PRF 81]
MSRANGASKLHDRLAGKQSLRREEQHRYDQENGEGVAVAEQAFRQIGLQKDFYETQQEATCDSARKAAETADDRGDEGLEHRQEAHQRIDAAALRHPENAGYARQKAGDRKGRGDDGIGTNAHEPHDGEILGGRTHGSAKHGGPQEEVQSRQHDEGYQDRNPLDDADMQAGNLDRAGKAHRHRDRLRAGRNEILEEHAQDGADGKTGQKQRGAACPAYRPEGRALHQEHKHDRDRQRHNDCHAERQADDQCEAETIAGRRHQLAMGEIDQAHDRKDDGKTKCQKRISAAEAERIDQLLQKHVHEMKSLCRSGAQIGALDFGGIAKVGRGAREYDPAIGHHVAGIGDLERKRNILLHEQDRQTALAQARDEFEDLVDDLRRKTERRLVQ